jgi:hypothetical protein
MDSARRKFFLSVPELERKKKKKKWEGTLTRLEESKMVDGGSYIRRVWLAVAAFGNLKDSTTRCLG